MKLFKDKYLYITFLLCAVIAGIVFGYYMIRSGGIFTLFSDYNLQQIPFASLVNQTIKSGSQWSWSTDLGTQLIAGYSFYNLGSPFYWITLVFPYDSYPYLMGWLFVLKYSFAGAAAYAYSTYFLKDRKWGVLAGLLYAFAGFQSLNIMFFHFHDVVALFPLILIGLEEYIRNDRKSFFIFSIFINCITNYFFFVGEVVFVALYYVARCINADIKPFIVKGLKCVIYAAIGVAMTAVIILPSVLFILGNYRTAAGHPGLFYDRNQFLNICRGFIWPVDIQSDHATVNSGEWNSISLYLPLWGMSLYISYLIKEIKNKNKNRLLLLSFVLVFMSFIPILNSCFYGFTEATYKRWWYMLILLLALFSAQVMENRDRYNIREGIIINAVISGLFVIVVYLLNLILKTEVVKLNIVVIVFSTFATIGLSFIDSKKDILFYKLVVVLTAIVACFTTFCTVSLYRGEADDAAYLKFYKDATKLEDIDQQYRYNTNYNIISLVGNVGNMGAFSSTVSNSVAEFHGNLGIFRENMTPYAYDHEYNRFLLGGKYNVVGTESGFVIDDSAEVCPIGYAVDSYITEDELIAYAAGNGYDAGVRLLIESAAIKSEDVANNGIDALLVHNSDCLVSDELATVVDKNIANKVDDFSHNKNQFSCVTNYQNDKVVYFTVPYDDGWSAVIDGTKANIMSSNGMMCMVVPAGQHKIIFNYMTPGLMAGIVISILALLVLIYITFSEKSKAIKSE